MKNTVTFFPVGNGDTTLISLKDNTKILIDCKFRDSSTDENDKSQFDVKKYLLQQLNKETPQLDVFILTHPDKDHCHGFSKNYYQGNPKDYADSNKTNGEIIIGELWVTPMIFTTEQSDDANAIRTEANRRLRLYKDDNSEKEKSGNRLRLIGYDEDKKFEGLTDQFIYVPGKTINEFNGNSKNFISIFIHSPFKKTLVSGKEEANRNSTSIVMQIRFSDSVKNENASAIIAGDAGHETFEQIIKQSKDHGNDKALKFDLLLAPHHCSWTFFNNVPINEGENNIPNVKIIDFLKNNTNPSAFIIASSNKVEDKEPNPPHYKAKEQYLEFLLEKTRFLNTSVYPSEKEPQPLIFEVVASGFRKSEKDDEVKDERKKQELISVIGKNPDRPWLAY